jgi:hypothetical protein
MIRVARYFLLMALFACGGGRDDGASDDQGALERRSSPATSCNFTGGTESYDGIEGTYERSGGANDDGETKTLEIRDVVPNPQHISSEARYKRTFAKTCAAAGCNEETGTVSLLPDNAAFPPNFAFTPTGRTLEQGGDMYFVLGLRRSGGKVSEACIAHVVTSQDVRAPILLKRVP